MVKYYKHKKHSHVICEIFNKNARFGKWGWKGDTCTEIYTHKEVTEDFKNAFEEITQKQFNDIWGNKLEQA